MSGNSHHPDKLDRVGGYNIDAIRIHPSTGEKALKIEFGFVTELNIYEDIQNNAITGSMEIVDTYNLIGNAQLQGNERLSFILETPGRGAAGMVATVDASEETGYPLIPDDYSIITADFSGAELLVMASHAQDFKLIEMSGGGALTIVDSGLFPVGYTVDVLQTGSSQVTIQGSGFTPNATPGLKLRTQWSSATLIKRALNSWVVLGDLTV